jgi:hypothetical protein
MESITWARLAFATDYVDMREPAAAQFATAVLDRLTAQIATSRRIQHQVTLRAPIVDFRRDAGRPIQ